MLSMNMRFTQYYYITLEALNVTMYSQENLSHTFNIDFAPDTVGVNNITSFEVC